MALESRVDVLVAALDLKVVQLIRQAIRAADQQARPWENRTPPAPKIKIARPHPDMIHKGTLLDFFI